MAWNKIVINQGTKELKLMLNETGQYIGPDSYTGRWYWCDPDVAIQRHSQKDLVWMYVGGILQIGGWNRSGYKGNDDERIFLTHVNLWPAKRDARGKLSVASASGDGNGSLNSTIGPHTSGLDMKKPVTWATMEFGDGSVSGSC